jgi:hypothetical protein
MPGCPFKRTCDHKFISICGAYHMPGGERRKPIDIEDRRTKVKVTTSKNRTKI